VLKIGIIGYGKMGQIRHREISANGTAEVVLIGDTAEVRSGVKCITNPDAVVYDPDIDAVFICTPNHLNKPLTIASLESGKHVFCEKPPALNSSEMLEIKGVEARTDRVLMYGFNHRHHESIRRMKRLIDNGTFGRILWMRGRYGKSVDKTFYRNWRAQRKLAGGGILIDQGIHMLDLFLYLGGDFDNVHASVSNLYWQLDVEDNVFATLENTKTGLAASLHSTMTQWRHLFSLEVFLEKGYMVLNGLKTSSNTYGDEVLTIAQNRSLAPAATWEDEEDTVYHTDESWKSEINEFFSAILEGRKARIGHTDDALRLMRIIDKIYSFRKDVGSG